MFDSGAHKDKNKDKILLTCFKIRGYKYKGCLLKTLRSGFRYGAGSGNRTRIVSLEG